ncbi:PP_RS20740 family protein [Micromonospora sp. DT227]|uniref:PP_RS20740 family protein n=1 Tax=Micromonospora sp. DT227 TaxID=3393433 RepID=UPI003CF8E08D
MTYEDLDDENYIEQDLPVPDEEPEELAPAYQPPVPLGGIPRQFKPWHRPRKQYVRRKQWVNSFADLLDHLSSVDNKKTEVNYIGLPGSDLLDVRLLSEECAKRGFMLRYLGFDRTATTDSAESAYLLLSEDELSKSGHIHRESKVMPDEFLELADENSMAYASASRLSFDVVNLDFCGSATNSPAGQGDIYKALLNLFKVQWKRNDPWILLLTSAFDRDGQGGHGHHNAAQLVGPLEERLTACERALAEAQKAFGAGSGMGLPELDSCGEEVYSRWLLFAFTSWLCNLGRQVRSARFKLISVFSYRLSKYHPAPNMFSLVMRVTPYDLAVHDPSRLIPAPELPDECAELEQHAVRMGVVKDVDAVLRADEFLFEEMRADMANLLADLRYDREAYLSSDFSKRIEDSEGAARQIGLQRIAGTTAVTQPGGRV